MNTPRRAPLRLDRIDANSIAEQCGDEWAAKGESSLYADSPFLPLWRLSSRRKGASMEDVCERVLAQAGYPVGRSGSSEHDRVVNGLRVEIKGSFLWDGNQPRFTWQQIRPSQDYQALILLAFYPDYLGIRAARWQDVHRHLAVQNPDGTWPYNQHGGKHVNSGTYVMHGHFSDYPWLQPARKILGRPRPGQAC